MPVYETLYERERDELIRSMLPRGSGIAVDIGCNDGRFTAMLAGAGYGQVIGYDSDEQALKRAVSEYPDIDFRLGHDDFSVSGRSLTMALELIEHIPPAVQLQFLRAIRASMLDDGRLFLSTPGRYSFLSVAERVKNFRKYRLVPYTWWDPTHVSVISYAKLVRLLEAADFVVERRAGFCYAPTRWMRPRATHGRLARAGFDVVVVARAV